MYNVLWSAVVYSADKWTITLTEADMEAMKM